jgi:Trk K+ transport system NAD-binding subunit
MSDLPEFGAYHTHSRGYWISLCLGVSATLILGGVGFWIYTAPDYPGAGFADIIHHVLESAYQTLQLFVLHTPEFSSPPNIFLDLARFLGAFVFISSVLGAAWQVMKMGARHAWYSGTSDHIIICGAGWRGLALARDFYLGDLSSKKGVRSDIIVLERDPESRGVAECQRLGIPYLIGDASNPEVLASVGAARARKLVAVCGSDEVNLEIIVRAAQIERVVEGPLRCHVHLSNDDLRTMVRQKGFSPGAETVLEISTFGTDIYENAARRLFHDTPLDRVPIGEHSPLEVHLVIIGFSEMGQAILMQAACIAHYANVKRPKITVVDPNARALGEDFERRHSGIANVAEVTYLDRVPHDSSLVNLVTGAARKENVLATCAICFEDEKVNLALAVKLGDALKDHPIPVRWWQQSRADAGLRLVFSERLQRQLDEADVRPFGMLENVCNAETLELKEPDEMGRAIHEFYLGERWAQGETLDSNPSLQSWELLPESFKNSNRLAADHIEIKMRALGYHLERKPTSGEPILEFRPDQIEILARMEHARYCAERFMDGWRRGERKDPVAKTNPTLVPWGNELPPVEQEKDREQVRKIPHILEKAGWYICR